MDAISGPVMEQSSANGQATDVDDDYLRWQEEIRLAEEEAEAMKAGKSHRYHKDFRKQVDFAEDPVAAAVEEEPVVEASAPEVETEFTDDDGTVYKWDPYRNAWIPQASPEIPLCMCFMLIEIIYMNLFLGSFGVNKAGMIDVSKLF